MGQGVLSVPSSTLRRIADVVGTPVYVYDAQAIRESFSELTDSLSGVPHRIYYSVKANSNLTILRLIRSLGAGADIVSGGELVRASSAGFAGREIVFSGVGKTEEELSSALDAGVGLINVESQSELAMLRDLASSRQVTAQFGIRVNPDVTTDTHPYTQTGERGMKFGVPLDDVAPMVRWSAEQRHLDFSALGVHIGSQITDAQHYANAVGKLLNLLQQIETGGTVGPRSLGIGGGLGIAYRQGVRLEPSAFAEAVRPLWEKSQLPIALEPGRCLVGNAGSLLTRCVRVKESGGRKFVVVDAAMNDFLRPSLYGAEHDINVVGAESGNGDCRYDVVGPVCETGDFLGTDRVLPETRAGALLAIAGAGAYGFTMSSTYNSRPRAAEVMVDGDRWTVIRARENRQDLMRGEIFSDDELCWETGSEA